MATTRIPVTATGGDTYARKARVTTEALAVLAEYERVKAGGGTLEEARALAGLSIPQAAKLLGWHWSRLAMIETGHHTATDEERGALCALYRVAGFATPATGSAT